MRGPKKRQKERAHRGLERELQAEKAQSEQSKLKLNAKARELEKEKLDRREKEAQLFKERQDRREKEAQLFKDKTQTRHLKSKLDAKTRELQEEVTHLRSRLEAKVKELAEDKSGKQRKDKHQQTSDKHQLAQFEQVKVQWERDARRALKSVQDQLLNAEARLVELEEQVEVEKRRAENATLCSQEKKMLEEENQQLRQETSSQPRRGLGSLLQNVSDVEALISNEKKSASAETLRFSMVCGFVLAAAAMFGFWRRLRITTTELDETKARLSIARAELNSELGGMIKVNQSSRSLGMDFTYNISDEMIDQEKVRSIKIQCPGVRHSDVSVEIIFNGCVVTISRQPSQGVGAFEWVQRFQFRPSEGLFEFKEDQATLECGFLTLVFRAYDFQSRPFRFPVHFDMSAADPDGTYDFPEESAGNGTEASMRGGTAPGRLEMTAAVEAEFGDNALAAPGAETSGSPVDTEDYEAVARQVALDAAVQGFPPASTEGENLAGHPAASAESVVPASILADPTTDRAVDEVEAPAEEQNEGSPERAIESGAAPAPTLSASPPASSSSNSSEDLDRVLQEYNVPPEEGEGSNF